MTLYQFNRLS